MFTFHIWQRNKYL